MTIAFKHAFVSTKPDVADTSLVRASNWNADHVLTMATGKILGRATAGTGDVEELNIAVDASGNLTTGGYVSAVAGFKIGAVNVLDFIGGYTRLADPDGISRIALGTTVAGDFRNVYTAPSHAFYNTDGSVLFGVLGNFSSRGAGLYADPSTPLITNLGYITIWTVDPQPAIQIGNAGDPSNYYHANNHNFYDYAGGGFLMTEIGTGGVTIHQTTSSTNPTTGALKVAGGAGIAENLNVGGGLGVVGDTYVYGTTHLAVNGPGAGGWYDSVTTGVNRYYLGTDAGVADTFRLYSSALATNIIAANSSGVSFGIPIVGYGYIRTVDITDSIGTTTGALRVSGGAGIEKNLNVGGSISASETLGYRLGAYDFIGTDGAGYIWFLGKGGNSRLEFDDETVGYKANYYYAQHHHFHDRIEDGYQLNAVIDSNGTRITVSTPSTNTTSGSFQTAGGAGIVGDLHIGGTIVATGGRNSGGVLRLAGGDANTAYSAPTITFGYDTADQFRHWIHTRHNTSAPTNAFDFYTCDGTQFGTFPTNGVLGLTIENGSISSPNYAAFGGAIPGADNDFVVWPGVALNFLSVRQPGDTSGSNFSVSQYPDSGIHMFATLVNYNNSGYGEGFAVAYARGTAASPAALSSGDEVGYFEFGGYDGTAFRGNTWIQGTVDGTVSTGVVPTAMSFHTQSIKRLRINSAGTVDVLSTAASTSTSTGALTVAGGVGIAGDLNVGGYLGITGIISGYVADGSYAALLHGTTLALRIQPNTTSVEVAATDYTGSGSYQPLYLSGSTITLNVGPVSITDTTASTSTTTGALKVAGGVGIAGALNVGGDITSGASIIATNVVEAGASNTTGFWLGGNQFIYYDVGYVEFRSIADAGRLALEFGPAADPGNYYHADFHYFTDRASVVPWAGLDTAGFDLLSGSYLVASTKVVGARDTGWTAMTGTPNKAATYDTSTVTLAQLAARVAQLQASLTAHGLIGA